ncbi:hypothetical protein RHSIM_Rhsim12G0174300 [Rhododendron simsii]|uniref:Uncharacterized protein n=1 Tax=Rhododendron simsii TaxID=118357 RepID=A0A834LA54_RHOSS|nr:hypothetical protein RHSIM_Rhsim12G0174300 [Rhododendron simsii]
MHLIMLSTSSSSTGEPILNSYDGEEDHLLREWVKCHSTEFVIKITDVEAKKLKTDAVDEGIEFWRVLQTKLNDPCPFNGLAEIAEWMGQGHSDSQFPSLVSKIVLAAAICHIWGERNRRIFQHCGLIVQLLEAKSVTDIRACLCSWRRVQKSDANLSLSSLWHLPA